MYCKPEKILLLMCNWLGDTFWAIQVIPALKEKYPGTEIWAGVKPHSKGLLHGLIDDDKIIVLENVISDRHREKFSFHRYTQELKKVKSEDFDIAIDLTGNRYSALFLRLCGIKYRIGLHLNKLSFLYNVKGPEFDHSKHLLYRPQETIKLLFDFKISDQLISPQSPVSNKELSLLLGNISLKDKIALLVPGAGWEKKQWGVSNFAECGKLLKKNGYRIIIAGSPAEKKLCNELAEKIIGSIAFNLPLPFFIALIKHIDIAVSNDNGAGHLIAASGKKLISIFCADTVPELCAPMGKDVTVIDKSHSTVDFITAQLQ